MNRLKRNEEAAFALRDIYEQYGYEKYRMGKFEEYDLYADNRDFLGCGQILTFTDPGGRLMALRPDVTMSIVKNTRATRAHAQKLYYMESVYRAEAERREFREITQVGVEYIGEVTLYTQAEIIALALKSLACIHPSYVLDIGHAGFLGELLLGLPAEKARLFARCIEQKSAHELESLLLTHGVEETTAQALRTILGLRGSLCHSLALIKPFIKNDAMRMAYEELEAIAGVFADEGEALRLDFSFTSNSKYYNGLLLRGYVENIPCMVLSGGRYDPLMARMGKNDLGAVGFAVYFDEVERSLREKDAPGFDAVVLYDDDTGLKELCAMVESLVEAGVRVCAAKALPLNAGHAKVYRAGLKGGVE